MLLKRSAGAGLTWDFYRTLWKDLKMFFNASPDEKKLFKTYLEKNEEKNLAFQFDAGL